MDDVLDFLFFNQKSEDLTKIDGAFSYAIKGSCPNQTTSSTTSVSQRTIGYDGKYMYVAGENTYFLVSRVDISGDNPVIDKYINYANTGMNLECDTGCIIRDMAYDDDYIYFPVRSVSGSADATKQNGGILTIDKSRFVVVGMFQDRDLYTSVCVYDHYLLACRRTGGWAVYDKSDPTNLVRVWESCSGWNAWDEESQTVRMAFVNNVPIACIIGFGSPIRFYNFTDPTNPVLLWTKKVSVKSGYINAGHTYHCVVDGSMVYATAAPSTATTYSTYLNSGVIVLDISDVLNGNVVYELSLIPADDVSIEKMGDTQPTFIEKWKNYLLLPDYKKSIRVFKINADKSVSYVTKWQMIDPDTGRYPVTRSVLVDNRNRLLLPAYKTLDTESGTLDGTDVKIYSIKLVDK